MPLKVVFRCDAGPDYGLGRLSRCLGLAHALTEGGAEVSLLVHGGGESMALAAGYETIALGESDGPAHLDLLTEHARGAELVVIDAREIGGVGLARAKRALAGARLIVVDDTAGRFVSAHALVDPSVSAYRRAHEVSLECKLLLGAEFAPIRPDVLNAPANADGTPRVVVSLGAGPDDGQTRRVVRLLNRLDGEFAITAVVGPGFSDDGELDRRADQGTHGVEIVRAPDQVGPLYSGAMLGVCAGGVTATEFAFLGVPAAYLALNARGAEDAEALERDGAGLFLGQARDVNDDRVLAGLEHLMSSRGARDAMTQSARALVDGEGAKRILSKLTKYGLAAAI
ncbi:MAG: hypothetical protein M5R36_17565 [Deltaproteobacteria bacterium]|nr:hypothetical protein [Deltaproteobacteria bacterium]